MKSRRRLCEMVKRTRLLLQGQVRRTALEQKNGISPWRPDESSFLYNTLDTINWKAIERKKSTKSVRWLAIWAISCVMPSKMRENHHALLGEEIAWLKSICAPAAGKTGSGDSEFLQPGFHSREKARCIFSLRWWYA